MNILTDGFRAEKDRSSMYQELNGSRSAIDQLGRDKVRRIRTLLHFFTYMSEFFCDPVDLYSMLWRCVEPSQLFVIVSLCS